MVGVLGGGCGVRRHGRRATAAFVMAPVAARSSIARALGCDVDRDGYIVTSDTGATSHPLVWAAGDVRRPPRMPIKSSPPLTAPLPPAPPQSPRHTNARAHLSANQHAFMSAPADNPTSPPVSQLV